MSTLYIANTTKQNWHHSFRVPELDRVYFVQIPSGEQVFLPKTWNVRQLEAVVTQMERYGARQAKDVSGKLSDFPGLLYQFDKPISESQILGGHEALVDHQERRSAAEATKAALGFDASTRDPRTKKRMAKNTKTEIRQDKPATEKPSSNDVSFSVEVDESGHDDLKLS